MKLKPGSKFHGTSTRESVHNAPNNTFFVSKFTPPPLAAKFLELNQISLQHSPNLSMTMSKEEQKARSGIWTLDMQDYIGHNDYRNIQA